LPEPYVFRGGIFSVGIGPIPEHPAHASQSDLDSYVSNGGPFGYLGHPVPLFGGELGCSIQIT